MFKWADIEGEVDELISELGSGDFVGGTSTIRDSSQKQFKQQQYYQLPVKVSGGGKPISEEDKETIIGHFAPGVKLNLTHPKGHSGVDLKAPKGTPVYPIGPGVVKKVIGNWKTQNNIHTCSDFLKRKKNTPSSQLTHNNFWIRGIPTAGNMVIIEHEDGKVKSVYLHLDEVKVSPGNKVGMSTVIGTVGETGNAMCRGGGHIHYEVRINNTLVDPQGITGKPVGSLSKKAEFVNRLIHILEKKQIKLSREKRFMVLKKIATYINNEI